MNRGTTIPLSCTKKKFISKWFGTINVHNLLLNPTESVHLEVPTGTFTELLWQPPQTRTHNPQPPEALA